MAYQESLVSRTRASLSLWVVIAFVVLLITVMVGAASAEAQNFVALSVIILGVGALLLRRAAQGDSTLTFSFLMTALGAHILGSLLRFAILANVYHGIGDANGYVGNGARIAAQLRSLQLPALPKPGTDAMTWVAGLLFAVTGPTMLGGFVMCASMSFVGAFFFYKAFRVAFPNGNARLYAWLIFFLPSMWYWPSSLGKDSVMVMFLGIGTYGFALLFNRHLSHGLTYAVIGMAGAVMIRPPVAYPVIGAALAAFLLRPARARSPQMQGLVWLAFIPILIGMAALIAAGTHSYVGSQSLVSAFQQQQASDFNGGSNFTAPNPFTPLGLPAAIITVNLRPFPWEAGGPLPALAALEGVLLLGVLIRRRREIWRGLRQWHTNGMIVMVLAAWFSVSIVLSSLSNFGLLARQRTQVLPYLFFLPAMVMPVGSAKRNPEEREPEEGQAFPPEADRASSG